MTVIPHYFIGAPIPSDLKEMLTEWQNKLTDEFLYKQWTNKEDFHITLKFLGPVQPDNIEKVKYRLNAVNELPSFSLVIEGIQTFGNPASPRVLFANVHQMDPLLKLVELVESSMQICGFAKEKREFRPHITLAKKWKTASRKVQAAPLIEKFHNEKHVFSIDHINLYQIHPNETPKYEVIKTFSLNGTC
ncbi:RNA 2',3'-cyclic phosphodiesterase [Virgibacillus phasianinus]|uniref:RNA 2',3'-cyclic phosphodiesterase n=1 Tax=Virgibacillus phasianinus TaxID=2017483 RepID=A0A220U5A9_9BACI|nr:RNA 2',3'-cyclic phosphodiesterase [Virgibacillus phasianinus]ASK62913.1 RNA 2',3'-cyclic phosphodiesterase [Virgibacillus phasianinus]